MVFALSSCGTEQGGPTGEDEEQPPREVTREVTKTVTVAEAPEDKEDEASVSASPSSEPPDEQAATQEESPEEVLALQYRLINEGDYEGAYALFADESKLLITPEQYAAYFGANAPYSITDYSFLSVDDRGDEATVEAALTASSGSGQESYQVSQQLVRQGAVWRVVMRDEQASNFATAGQETAQLDEPESENPQETAQLDEPESENPQETAQYDEPESENPQETAQLDEPESENPQETAQYDEPESEPTPEGGFGDGTHRVGSDIQPGTYRTEGSSGCYYARLSGFSGEIDDIVANGVPTGSAVVTIAPTDAGFESRGCGTWTLLE